MGSRMNRKKAVTRISENVVSVTDLEIYPPIFILVVPFDGALWFGLKVTSMAPLS